MNLKQSLIKNTAYVGASQVINNILAYLVILIISQTLGAEGLGKYSFILAFAGFFFILSNFGTTTYLTTEGARHPSNLSALFSRILIFKTFSFLLFFFLYVAAYNLFSFEVSLLLFSLAGLFEAFTNMYAIPRAIFIIKHQGLKIALIDIVQQVFILLSAIYTLVYLSSLELFFFLMVAINFLRFFVAFLAVKNQIAFKFSIDLGKFFDVIKYSYPFMLVVIFSTINGRIDTIILGFLKSEAVVGWYNAGYKIIDALTALPAVLMAFAIPSFSSLFEKNKLVAKKLLEKLIYYSYVILMPVVIGSLLVGGRIIDYLYGFDSQETILSFKILIVASIFIFLSTITGSFLAAIKKQRVFAVIAGVGALANIILNIIFIPKYSLYGAGAVTGITYLLMFGVMVYYIRKNVITLNFLKNIYVPLIAGLLMIPFILLLSSQHLFIIILVAALVYLIPLAIFELKTEKDILNFFKKR